MLRASGDPGGPSRQPWHTMRLCTSTPSRMSVWSGTLKFGSARRSPERCFDFWLNGTGKAGSLVVTFGRTAASTFHWESEILSVLDDFWFAMVNDTMEHNDKPCFSPPVPVTRTFWWWRGSRRRCAKCSVMNEVDEAQSSKALALVIRPPDVATTTWLVIRSVLRLLLGSGCVKWELWHVESPPF